MELSSKLVFSLSKKTYTVFSRIYKNKQKEKFQEFLEFIDLRYEMMKPEEQQKLNEYINSDLGQELLCDYMDSIIKTSSQRARMATALLFCKDTDFKVNEVETRSFISAMHGMSDDLLDFFLEVTKIKPQESSYPYPRAGVNNLNFESFKNQGWDEEAVFINTNELIGLRLLLPDPQSYTSAAGNSDGWAIWFGVTKTSLKMVNLINKATALLQET